LGAWAASEVIVPTAPTDMAEVLRNSRRGIPAVLFPFRAIAAPFHKNNSQWSILNGQLSFEIANSTVDN
jgi:hypothetical protein